MAAVLVKFLNWDRLLGALLGFLLAWALLAFLNQFIWLPDAKEEGKQEERTAQLARSIEIIKERNRTNAQVNALTDADLCHELGGVWVLADKRCD